MAIFGKKNSQTDAQFPKAAEQYPAKSGPTKEEMAFTNCPAVKLLVNPFPCTTFANNGFKDTCRMVLPIPNKANAT